jgi:golgi to ER traffic protein 4
LAQEYFKENDYVQAHKHFSRASSPEAHASMIFDWSLSGNDSEKDLFITRALLQLLCVSDVKEAKYFFEEYVKLHCEVDETFNSKSPLLNFCRFLMLSIEKKNLELFQMLQDKYEFHLQRDQHFSKYLKGIGAEHFGMVQSESGLGGLFASLFAK